MTAEITIETNVPPVLKRRADGTLAIEVTNGRHTIIAPLGDGSYFFDRVCELMLIPALQQLGPVSVAVREPVEDQDI